VLPVFSSEMYEKLIELTGEELYDMSNKKYSECLGKKNPWGQIGEVRVRKNR
jgi:hypothetical protein